MEAIFAPIILVAIAFGIFVVARSDGSPSEKAMLILIICVGGVIGGAIVVALIMTSPVLAIIALLFVAIFVGAFLQSIFGDSFAANKLAKDSQISQTVSDASAESVLKKFENIDVGDEVDFGKYRWVVIDKNEEGNEALLLTNRVVLHMEFHKKKQYSDWEDSTLRKYLNGPFFNNSFGAGEKSLILEKTLENYSIDWGKRRDMPETKDKVFLLPKGQMGGKYRKYKNCPPPSDYGARRCWTRTGGRGGTYFYYCTSGSMGETNSAWIKGGVRPLMWVRIK